MLYEATRLPLLKALRSAVSAARNSDNVAMPHKIMGHYIFVYMTSSVLPKCSIMAKASAVDLFGVLPVAI